MKEVIKEEISVKLSENYKYLEDLFGKEGDLVLRNFSFGKFQALVTYFDGMSDKVLLDDFILRSLMFKGKDVDDINKLKDKIMSVTEIKEINSLKKGIDAIMTGEAMIFFEGLNICYIISCRAFQTRSVSEPSTEASVRGPKDGFVETLRFNTALVRRRIRDTRFKIVSKKLGERSKTDIAIMYIDDIVNKHALDTLLKKIDTIKIDSIGESSYVDHLIENFKHSPFPQFQNTERPDVLVSAIFEGRIGIIVDNSPWAIIAPTTLSNLFQSADDYTQTFISATFTRIIRVLASIICVLAPALYIALTSFSTYLIPTKFVHIIASTREGIPFSAAVEAIIMELSIMLLLEALTKLPKFLGSTIGIVGGLVIGQSAVNAGLVSPVMVIVVAITTLTSFMTNNYELVSTLRLLRIGIMILASMFGIYGIIIGIINIIVHLTKIENFKIPYLAPMVDVEFGENFKDFIFKFHIASLKTRPGYMNIGDKGRMKYDKKE